MFFGRTLLLILAYASPALAQSDGGVEDAGPVDAGDSGACDPRCEGDTLRFCDGEEPTALDCATLEARCGELSAAWGADCLLPAGAACDPGYGFGESRCDRAASLYCVDGACAVAGGPSPAEPLEPTPGTQSRSSGSSATDPFGCDGCSNTSAAGLFLLAGALKRKRRPRPG